MSIAIYTVTLAWIFTLLPEWTRMRRAIGWITAITMVLEMAIIGTQAWRGTTSHFNVGTPLDAVLFLVMGAAIVVQTFSTVAVAIALWRHRFDDRRAGRALRFGMAITIAGALTAGLMTRPTTAQLEAARAGERMTVSGAHTVGAADGGPGLAGTGWSTQHGDMRVPHFIGLHALQALPLLVLPLTRAGVDRAQRARSMLVAGPSYAAFCLILLIQALRGVPLVAPDDATLAQLGAWAVGTAIAAGLAMRADVKRHGTPRFEGVAMSADQIFSIANLAAVLCWILLAAFPDRRWVTNGVAGTAMPALFAAAYIAIVIAVFPRADGSFSTLAGVAAAVHESMAAPRRLAPLSRLRLADWHVGSPRQRRARRAAVGAGSVSVPHADVRPGRVDGLQVREDASPARRQRTRNGDSRATTSA